jgi:hypothetical protein
VLTRNDHFLRARDGVWELKVGRRLVTVEGGRGRLRGLKCGGRIFVWDGATCVAATATENVRLYAVLLVVVMVGWRECCVVGGVVFTLHAA